MKAFEIIVGIVTILGFLITIWQLLSLSSRVKRIEEEARRKYKDKMDLVTVTSILSLIYDIQDDLTIKDDDGMSTDKLQLIIVKMRQLNDQIRESQNEMVVNRYGRTDHERLVAKVSSNLNVLRSIVSDPNSLDLRYISKDLQDLHDSMRMISNYLKKGE